MISSIEFRKPSLIVFAIFFVFGAVVSTIPSKAFGQRDEENDLDEIELDWESLPDLPDELGVAGPFVGVHNGAIIVAGGANFPRPVFDNDKQWHDRIYVLRNDDGDWAWTEAGRLPRPIGYGAAVSTESGVICMGGNVADETFDQVFAIQWDDRQEQVTIVDYPPLPLPCAYSSATFVGGTIYLAGGQSGQELDTAMTNFWSLQLDENVEPIDLRWSENHNWPGKSRAFNLTVGQHNGYDECVYVMSGRRQGETEVEFLTDVWEFNTRTERWRQRSDMPRCMMAGTGIRYGQSHLFVLGGADGSLWDQAAELGNDHPGFPKVAYAYNTITDSWCSAGASPLNQVTTIAVEWDGKIIIASGEIRPRVRTNKVWMVAPASRDDSFGLVNYSVLIGYLLLMVVIGVMFARRNKNTNDYFRGGKHIPWWAAGCSIFATMLSSLTYTGIPSKAFAQDWVYAVGNMMIPLVAFIAVFVALPFYRRLDVTSAYEYLEKRFSRGVRLFGSASFTLFHIFRMAVVMSLTGLALAVASPLTPAQSVLLMGILSIIYCTMGGIEAVIWTDTIQTFVLMGGAILAVALLVGGSQGGWQGAYQVAIEGDKLRIANFHLSATSAQLALWVVVFGAIGQNISSYTADQAVVQRYMTTKSKKRAASAIWTNALLTIPATLLFFGIGTALYAFYRSHPGRLDPNITTDQVFPLFIASEMPIGVAGLIVAGVFSAAQSTVSTSMNSTATSVVTDFLRPWNLCRSETAYLRAAQGLTLLIGILGTMLGLVFVDPSIKSLFDSFIQVIGLFMGVLGGLFVLGAMTKRANAIGAMVGALGGASLMMCLWMFSEINGYLYTVCGITFCVSVGYLVSLLSGGMQKDLSGLTVHTLETE